MIENSTDVMREKCPPELASVDEKDVSTVHLHPLVVIWSFCVLRTLTKGNPCNPKTISFKMILQLPVILLSSEDYCNFCI